MLQSLLTEAQAEFLREEKDALADIRLALAGLEAPRDTLATLQQAILQLDELFLLVVVGEFNAGKSALMNALLGAKVLAEGVTPTTSRVTLVKWGETITERVMDENFAVFTHPLPLLRQLNIVDTPGTNAVIREHERLTNEFVPRSDLVLFVTSADRPLTESERQFLVRLRDWGKKVVLVLNKADILDSPTALEEVRTFVLQHASSVLGLTPEFFPVSARMGQQARAAADPGEGQRLWEASRLHALEEFIYNTLDDQARLRLKLTSPLGVAEHLVGGLHADAEAQAEALSDDTETVGALENVLAAYDQDLRSELAPRLAEIENILVRLQERGLDFFDRVMRLTNILNLARGDQVRRQFEAEVLADVPRQVEERVHRLIDWLVQKDLHQWQQIMNYLQRRQARYTEHLAGSGAAPLDARRRALIDSVGRTAQTIVETYNRDEEARALAANVESAVASVALIEAGAVGLGALVLTAVASTAVDITGMLAAGTLAIVGLFVIPYKRQQAKESFREKMEDLRRRLGTALSAQFTSEADAALGRVKDGVLPYTRFVRAERERVDQALNTLEALQRRLSALKARAESL
jgi:small GTP-binding protein